MLSTTLRPPNWPRTLDDTHWPRTLDDAHWPRILDVSSSSSDCSKLGHYTQVLRKATGGPVPTEEFSSLQFHCFRIIPTKKNMMSSVENFLNRSYPRFASTTTTTTADIDHWPIILDDAHLHRILDDGHWPRTFGVDHWIRILDVAHY